MVASWGFRVWTGRSASILEIGDQQLTLRHQLIRFEQTLSDGQIMMRGHVLTLELWPMI